MLPLRSGIDRLETVASHTKERLGSMRSKLVVVEGARDRQQACLPEQGIDGIIVMISISSDESMYVAIIVWHAILEAPLPEKSSS